MDISIVSEYLGPLTSPSCFNRICRWLHQSRNARIVKGTGTNASVSGKLVNIATIIRYSYVYVEYFDYML